MWKALFSSFCFLGEALSKLDCFKESTDVISTEESTRSDDHGNVDDFLI